MQLIRVGNYLSPCHFAMCCQSDLFFIVALFFPFTENMICQNVIRSTDRTVVALCVNSDKLIVESCSLHSIR